MAITRSYWMPVSYSPGTVSHRYGFLDDTTTSRPMDTQKAWTEYFSNPVLAEAARVKTQHIGDYIPGWMGNWGLTQTGTADPLPTLIKDYEDIRVDNRKEWAAAKRPNSIAIVVSDYQKGRYTIAQEYGSGNLTGSSYQNISPSMAHSSSWIGSTPGKYPNTFDYKGLRWAGGNTIVSTRFRRVTGLFDQSPMSLGFPMETLTGWMEQLPNHFTKDAEMVTNCLASANSGLVDLLTSMAETPELLKSILDGCKTILRMYLDAKRGNLRFINKSKRIRLEIERENARFLRVQRSAEFDRIRDTEAHLTKIKTLERNVKELLTAAANVWLNFRLNIYPTAKTIEATLEALEKIDSKFLRNRELLNTVIEPPSIDGWTLSGNVSIAHRAFIKRGAHRDEMKKLLFTQSPVLTMWELVPFSFIVDRYMNIGNFISASLYRRNTSVTEGATYSWKVDSGFVYTHSSGAVVTVNVNLYRREVIDPSRFICIPTPDERTRFQHLDHLALSWNLLLNRFKTGR